MKSLLLQIYSNDQFKQEIELKDGISFNIGRGKDNDIIFEDQIISSKHALIEIKNGGLFITDLESTNGTYVNQNRIASNIAVELKLGDNIRLSNSKSNQLIITEKSEDNSFNSQSNKEKIVSLNKNTIRIGRSPECDIVLEDRTTSRVHAEIKKNSDGTYSLKDLNSTNGTFFKDKKITTVTLQKEDHFIIGRYIFSTDGRYEQLDRRTVIKLQSASKKYDNGVIGIHPITLEVQPKTLTAIMGPSGCGKSTLLKMLNGISPHTSGKISVFDLDLRENFNFFKHQIGYVPQDDTIHLELTVYQSLYYAAKIRLEHVSDKRIHNKIDEILRKLKIEKVKDHLNYEISGGQRKRVCIALELLSDPMLLLLDEPTSPLDPQSIAEFMDILKDLVDSGTTIIMVTHKPDDLQFMDEVIFLSNGGYLSYKGKTSDYLTHFQAESTVEVYSKLSVEESKNWRKEGNEQYISKSVHNKTNFPQQHPNWGNQVRWLTVRNIKTKTNDLLNTSILIFQAPIIAVLIAVIFEKLTVGLLFMLVISSIWFGVNNASREIVKERHILLREYLFNLKISSYFFSKVLMLTLLGALQTFLFTLIIGIVYQLNNPILTFVWLLFINIASSLLGLLLSSSMKSTDKVLALVPLVLIPQVMLSGLITPIYNGFVEFISYFTFSRWGTEGLTILQGDDYLKSISSNFHENYYSFWGDFAETFWLDFAWISGGAVLIMILTFQLIKKGMKG